MGPRCSEEETQSRNVTILNRWYNKSVLLHDLQQTEINEQYITTKVSVRNSDNGLLEWYKHARSTVNKYCNLYKQVELIGRERGEDNDTWSRVWAGCGGRA